MTASKKHSDMGSPPQFLKESQDPLWRRTQLRLRRGEASIAQRTNTFFGTDRRLDLIKRQIVAAQDHLVDLLKTWEERQSSDAEVRVLVTRVRDRLAADPDLLNAYRLPSHRKH